MFIYAHRGSSVIHPENTLEAFAAAIKEGADGIETDLRLTADEEIVLCHDPYALCEGGVRLEIRATKFRELKRRCPTLATLGELYGLALGKAALNLELKDPRVVPHLGPWLEKGGEVLITSFNLDVVREAGERYPGIKRGPVFDHWGESEKAFVAGAGMDAVSLNLGSFNPDVAESCRREGASLLLWTVNDPAQAKELKAQGVYGVFTDWPERLKGETAGC